METGSGHAAFDALLERMERNGVCAPGERAGCAEEEIDALEARYGVRVPTFYRRYLAEMGHDAGRLFRHDHTRTTYRDVLEMTAEERGLWSDYAPPWELPADALIISSRQGDYFHFIRCDGGADSPVWLYDVYRWALKETSRGIVQWLEGWCAEAERAIAHGYFGDVRGAGG